jgi:hypothetical protein
MRTGLLALAVFVLLTDGPSTHAGPPDTPSGVMVLDEVAHGLREYRKASEPARRIAWLKRLAPSKDPRVAIALAEESVGDTPTLGADARQYMALLLVKHYVPQDQWLSGAKFTATALRWWEANGAELRRRARQLP